MLEKQFVRKSLRIYKSIAFEQFSISIHLILYIPHLSCQIRLLHNSQNIVFQGILLLILIPCLLYITQMRLQNILPILWLFASITVFVIMQSFIKILSQDISIQYIVCMRSVLLLALNSYFIHSSAQYQPYERSVSPASNNNMKYFSINIKNKKFFVLMLKRIFWNALSVNTFLISLRFVNLSIANALLNTTPVLNFFVEAAYYKKSIKPISLVISIICFIGIIIILDPASSVDQQHPLDWILLLPLISAFGNSLSWIYLHQMRSSFKEVIVLEYAYITQLLTSGLSIMIFGSLESAQKQQLAFEVFMSFRFYLFMLIIVVLAYATHYLRIMVLFKRKPSQILAYNYFGIILSIIFDVFLFDSHLQLMTIVGILLTGSGLLSQFILNWFGKQIEHS